MSYFPAYEAFGRDIGIGFARWRVYMHLVNGGIVNHVRPVEVKVSGLSSTLKMSRRKVTEALDWLIWRGYVIEHGRHERRVRVITLAWALAPDQAA